LGGNISEYGIGKLASYLDYVALDARDETVDRTTSLMTVDAATWGQFFLKFLQPCNLKSTKPPKNDSRSAG
jgi:hypothetical protein